MGGGGSDGDKIREKAFVFCMVGMVEEVHEITDDEFDNGASKALETEKLT
jgi:hypothetical protein